jgi:hypothetical protein
VDAYRAADIREPPEKAIPSQRFTNMGFYGLASGRDLGFHHVKPSGDFTGLVFVTLVFE